MSEHTHKWNDLPQSATIGTVTISKCSDCSDVKYKNTSLGIEQVIHKDVSGSVVSVTIKTLGNK